MKRCRLPSGRTDWQEAGTAQVWQLHRRRAGAVQFAGRLIAFTLRSQRLTQTRLHIFFIQIRCIYFDRGRSVLFFSCFDLSDTTVNTKVRTNIDVSTPKD